MRSTGYHTPQQRLFRATLRAFVALACVFLILPIVLIIPISFSSGSFLSYPLPGLSLRWYRGVMMNPVWMDSIANSLIIAVGATFVATTLGTLAAYGLSSTRFAGRELITALVVAPLIMPIVIFGLGVYFLFARIGLQGTFAGLIIAHAVLGSPFVVLTVMASLQGFDKQLIRASQSLGSTPFTTFRTVTFPIIAPGVFAGALFAFITSFDEIIVALFIASPAQFTLPRQLFTGLRDQIDPSIVAVTTLLVMFTVSLLLFVDFLRRRTARIMRKE
nr:ABC transporter permease [uncultured Roseovarius sp.]